MNDDYTDTTKRCSNDYNSIATAFSRDNYRKQYKKNNKKNKNKQKDDLKLDDCQYKTDLFKMMTHESLLNHKFSNKAEQFKYFRQVLCEIYRE